MPTSEIYFREVLDDLGKLQVHYETAESRIHIHFSSQKKLPGEEKRAESKNE